MSRETAHTPVLANVAARGLSYRILGRFGIETTRKRLGKHSVPMTRRNEGAKGKLPAKALAMKCEGLVLPRLKVKGLLFQFGQDMVSF